MHQKTPRSYPRDPSKHIDLSRWDPPLPTYVGPDRIGVAITKPDYRDHHNWIGAPRLSTPTRQMLDTIETPENAQEPQL